MSAVNETTDSQESSDFEDAEPPSIVFMTEQIHQYDILLKDNETYRQRMQEFIDLQNNIVNWLNVGDEKPAEHVKNEFDQEVHFPTVQSINELNLMDFSVRVRTYHQDAILKIKD